MELNERKLKILQAIIGDFITTAEPVGSRTLSKKYDLGVSPATIRNEMADLEDERIEDIRIMGGCVCIEVKDARTLNGFRQFAYSRGVFSRPFLKYMYAMVPYIIKEEELLKVLNVMKEWFA